VATEQFKKLLNIICEKKINCFKFLKKFEQSFERQFIKKRLSSANKCDAAATLFNFYDSKVWGFISPNFFCRAKSDWFTALSKKIVVQLHQQLKLQIYS